MPPVSQEPAVDRPARSARDEMIGAAERIVAERGLPAMSLREVQVAADQRNKSAAQYHFGSREGLIEAVVLTRMAPVNRRRQELLDEPPTPGAEVRELVGALVRPLAEQTVLTPSSHWARFVVQAGSDPTVGQLVRRSVEGAPYRELHRRLAASMNHVPTALQERRVDQTVGMVFMALAAAEAVRDSGNASSVDLRTQVEDLIDTAVAVLQAPSSPATLDALESSSTPLPS